MPKPNKFWIDETSPKQVLEEYIRPEKPDGTLWDIFESYEPLYNSPQEPPNKDAAWLSEQAQIIDEIAAKYFSQTKLNDNDIQNLLIAIDEALLPQDEQDWEDMDETLLPPGAPDWSLAKYRDVATDIAKTYLAPKNLNERTMDKFSESLERKLESLNREHIQAEQKAGFLKIIDKLDYYAKSKKDEIKTNLQAMWNSPGANDIYDDEDDDYDDDEDVYKPGSYNALEFGLACSNTFFGFGDDAGDTDYEEREQREQAKLAEYAAEITELLGFAPNPELQSRPVNLNAFSDEDWEIYDGYSEHMLCQNIYTLEAPVWADETRVLILAADQEDKELPIAVTLKALPREKYEELLAGYNAMIDTLSVSKSAPPQK